VKYLTNCRRAYRERPCLIPGCHASPVCFAHHPKHRGMGGANAGWAYNEGVPLCDVHHKRLDAQGETWALHLETQDIVRKLAPPFWEKVKLDHDAELEAAERAAASRDERKATT